MKIFNFLKTKKPTPKEKVGRYAEFVLAGPAIGRNDICIVAVGDSYAMLDKKELRAFIRHLNRLSNSVFQNANPKA